MESIRNSNYLFSVTFVDELARSGLKYACICPGSRSTPLTVALWHHPQIKTWIHLDERSGSYFALGMAKVLQEPIVLVCTSGTAAANFYPAVVEAFYSRVPLILLTGDRPPELWGWGANQTIDQIRLYGSHVKWAVSMPVPEATSPLLAFVRAQASRAYSTALEKPSGPVHLNFPFREPLEPTRELDGTIFGPVTSTDIAFGGRPEGDPFIRLGRSKRDIHSSDIIRIRSQVTSGKKGLIVCGPQLDGEFASCVTQLAIRLGYPVLADPLSQVRCGPHDTSSVIHGYDSFLRIPGIASSLEPELIIRFGAPPTSKVLGQYLESHRMAHQILVDDGIEWNDPFHAISEVIHAAPNLFCSKLLSLVEEENISSNWLDRWMQLDTTSAQVVEQEMRDCNEMFEGKLFVELSTILPSGSTLFVGNSMPVRDLDMFLPTSRKEIRFLANRGASGIDGVLSTALGAATLLESGLVLVVGDLSFYHDMNGLLAAKKYDINATIIVVNNDGGGIFSFLPQVNYPEFFEPFFGTPHGLTFETTAQLYQLAYQKVATWPEFRREVKKSLGAGRTTVIEVPSNREVNLELHRRFGSRITKVLQDERNF